MASTPTQPATRSQRDLIAQRVPGERSSIPMMALLLGWLIPGGGHMLLGKWIRGLLIFVSVLGMFLVGLGLDGKVYVLNTGDILGMLGFFGQLGLGLLYAVAHVMGWGSAPVVTTLADWGTKFIVVGGLLNIISAVDAHSLANGRKSS